MIIYNREDPRTVLPQLEKSINARFDGLLDFFYPVGSYYETSDVDFDPNKSWGGEWELELEGQVHISAGSTYVVNKALQNASDGGSKDAIVVSHSHTLNHPYIPDHPHTGYYRNDGTSTSGSRDRLGHSGAYYSTLWTVPSSGGGYQTYGGSVASNGSTGTDKNMQPYIIVNRWHRIN